MNYQSILARLTDLETAIALMQSLDIDRIEKLIVALRAQRSRALRQRYCDRLLGRAPSHSVMGTLLVDARNAGEL